MVIFLAALKGVPQDLYEAASIDGAGKFTQFLKITIPLITPVIFTIWLLSCVRHSRSLMDRL